MTKTTLDRKALKSNKISLQNTKNVGEIQLSDRQMQILNSKRSAHKHGDAEKGGDPPGIDEYQTVTASSTSWDDSSSSTLSGASSLKSSGQRPQKFYGQLLEGGAKLYDDTGASWDDAKSNTKSMSSTSTSSISPRSKSRREIKRSPNKRKKNVAKYRSNASADRATSLPVVKGTQDSKKQAEANGSGSTSTSSTISDKDRAFLRKMMQSYPAKKAGGKAPGKPLSKRTAEEPKATADAVNGERPGRSREKPKKSTLDGFNGEDTYTNKTVLKRVLERARKKNMIEESSSSGDRKRQSMSKLRSKPRKSGTTQSKMLQACHPKHEIVLSSEEKTTPTGTFNSNAIIEQAGTGNEEPSTQLKKIPHTKAVGESEDDKRGPLLNKKTLNDQDNSAVSDVSRTAQGDVGSGRIASNGSKSTSSDKASFPRTDRPTERLAAKSLPEPRQTADNGTGGNLDKLSDDTKEELSLNTYLEPRPAAQSTPAGYQELIFELRKTSGSAQLVQDFFRSFDKENQNSNVSEIRDGVCEDYGKNRAIQTMGKHLIHTYRVEQDEDDPQLVEQCPDEGPNPQPEVKVPNQDVPGAACLDSSSTKSHQIEDKAENSIPWSRVKLRSLENVGDVLPSEGSIPPAWTNVKLRQVTAPAGETSKVSETYDESVEKEEGQSEICDRIELQDASSKITAIAQEQITSPEPEYIGFGEAMIRLSSDQEPYNHFLPLEDETGVENPVCIISTNELVKGSAMPAESKAKVVWKLKKSEIKSMLLDPGNCHVRLIQNDETDSPSRELTFTNSRDTLRFANAVHGLEFSNISTGEDKSSIRSMDNEHPDRSLSTDHGEEVLLVSQLSQDEQSVLRAYRERNRTQEQASDKVDQFLETFQPMDDVNLNHEIASSANSVVKEIEDSLTADEQTRADKYQKMLKLKIPKDAVRHKMEKDEVGKKIMVAVLGEEIDSCNDKQTLGGRSNVSTENNEKAAPYQKMLKMLIPPEAVRHKMEKDGVDEHIRAIVFPETMGQNKNDPLILSAAEEKKAEPYRKMLKMKIPKEAVEHKMRKENVDSKIIQNVLGVAEEGKPSKALSEDDKNTVSVYQRMLKTSMPKEAIRQRMQKDGMTEQMISYVLGPSSIAQAKSTPSKKPKPQKTKGFRWDPLRSGEKLQKSIWAKKKSNLEDAEPEVEIEKHVEMFQQKETAEGSNRTMKTQKSGKEKVQMANLIDINRAQNIAISLRGFNEFSFDELCDVIEYLDPYKKVSFEKAPFLRDLLPTASESKAIKGFIGDSKRLSYSEQWLKKIVHVKRSQEKVKVLSTMASFSTEVTELLSSFQLLKDACFQVIHSEKLPDLLEMVRQIGNRMNEGCDEAAGFKLDFLPRLAQTKGSDKKTTALDLVVMIFAGKQNRQALDLTADLTHCHEASSRLVLGDLLKDVRLLGKSLDGCRDEINAIQKDMSFRRQQMSEDVQQSSPTNSLEGAYRRIEEFLSHADSMYSDLKTQEEDTLHMCKELADFFCEGGGEHASTSLLKILSEFASNLDKAVQKYDRQERIAKKREKKRLSAHSGSKKTAAESAKAETASGPAPKAKSLVLMVNEMLKISGDKAKEDFSKGINYENPDDRLKQIYEIEKSRSPLDSISSPVTGSARKRTLLETIEERQMTQGPNVAQQALTELAEAIENKQHYFDTDASTGSPVSTTISSNFSQSFDSNTDTGASCAGLLSKPLRASSEGPSDKITTKLSTPIIDLVEVNEDQELHIKRDIERSRYINRWTKSDPDQMKLESSTFDSSGGCDILTAPSEDSREERIADARRKQYISRWARHDADHDSDVIDLSNAEVESDSGAKEKLRERYVSRWASKVESFEESVSAENLHTEEEESTLQQEEATGMTKDGPHDRFRRESRGPSPEDAVGRPKAKN